MVKDDDQKSASGSTAEVNVQEGAENAVEDSNKAVKQQPSSSDASQPGEPQQDDSLPRQDEEAEEAHDEEQETSADDLRALEEELDKITVSAPTLYVVLVYILLCRIGN